MGRYLPLGRCIELGKLDIGRPFKIPSISRWQMLLVSELILTVFSDLLKSMDLIPEIRMYQSGNRFFIQFLCLFMLLTFLHYTYHPVSLEYFFLHALFVQMQHHLHNLDIYNQLVVMVFLKAFSHHFQARTCAVNNQHIQFRVLRIIKDFCIINEI